MIAAIYARQSSDQAGAGDKSESFTASFLIASLLLAGCGLGVVAGPPTIADPERAATVVIVRPWHFVGGGADYMVTTDGVNVSVIAAGEHVTLPVPEGERLVGLKSWQEWVKRERTVILQAERGRTYYFRVRPGGDINRITESEGLELVSKTTPSIAAPR